MDAINKSEAVLEDVDVDLGNVWLTKFESHVTNQPVVGLLVVYAPLKLKFIKC